jgi:hypothetical protein
MALPPRLDGPRASPDAVEILQIWARVGRSLDCDLEFGDESRLAKFARIFGAGVANLVFSASS